MFSDPVIGHQVLATVCAVLTGWLIFAAARRHAPFAASLGAGAAYVAWLPVFAGVGGQSPVYYNLPMMAGAAVLLALIEAPARAGYSRLGCAVMLLAGIALQIKYSAVFDGIFFGLTLLWLGWRSGWGLPRLAAAALGWIACALVPTGLALGAYAAMGHGEEFIQANFLSIFGDINSPLNAVLRLAALTFGLSPFLVCLWFVWQRRATLVLSQRWILAWFAASYAGLPRFRRLLRSLPAAPAAAALPDRRDGLCAAWPLETGDSSRRGSRALPAAPAAPSPTGWSRAAAPRRARSRPKSRPTSTAAASM